MARITSQHILLNTRRQKDITSPMASPAIANTVSIMEIRNTVRPWSNRSSSQQYEVLLMSDLESDREDSDDDDNGDKSFKHGSLNDNHISWDQYFRFVDIPPKQRKSALRKQPKRNSQSNQKDVSFETTTNLATKSKEKRTPTRKIPRPTPRHNKRPRRACTLQKVAK